MSDFDNGPVTVTGEERRHPALRILARACIAIARDRLGREQQNAAQESALTEEADKTEDQKEEPTNG